MRILSMDVGDRWIGVAVSDQLGWTAQGIGTIERKDDETDIKKISKMVEMYKPESIVLGLPKNMNGTLGPQSEKVIQFGNMLKDNLETEIVYWDERLTTVSAHKIMIEADMSRRKRKKKVDKMAAMLILQGYLDYLNNKRKEE
ncbi:Holliday junction resolvase RuvX [Xylanivirga thermophila]|uniref:Holliday junction resolvase RuvX n=1 Tax=Xylanivirga thermophila TaxID=2496273 RepID=UPI00101DC8BA|nr:Holliday junction resolvase RuvX [Xylanivirga thermophila]